MRRSLLIQNKLHLSVHFHFITSFPLILSLSVCLPPLCASFFSLSGLQGLANPVLHLAQLFDLDLAL